MKRLKNKLIPCDVPDCTVMCKGPQGLITHKSWAHDDKTRKRRLKAAQQSGLARIGTQRRSYRKTHVNGSAMPVVPVPGPAPLLNLQRAAKRLVPEQSEGFNYCPRCAQAVIGEPRDCQRCRQPLEGIRLAMQFEAGLVH